MSKLPLLLGGAALLLSAVPQTQAVDSDPSYTSQKSSSVYYRPTLRYYGKDYVIAYGFTPWDARSVGNKPVIVRDRLTLSEAQVARSGSGGPRVSYPTRKAAISKITAPRQSSVVKSDASAQVAATEASKAE